jgi:hypothetical protein
MMHRSDRSRLSAAPAGAAGLLTLALLVGPPLAGMDAMSSTAAPAQATAASATEDGHLPMALVGQWAFTTISGTTYWDKSTGAYLGDGTGARRLTLSSGTASTGCSLTLRLAAMGGRSRR